MIIAVDFDGTIVTHEYPKIGKPVPGALETLLELQTRGDQLILWTMRSGKELLEAVDYCQKHGIVFFGINENPDQKSWTDSPKAYAQIYIDDAALNATLREPMEPGGRPYLDWHVVRHCLIAPML